MVAVLVFGPPAQIVQRHAVEQGGKGRWWVVEADEECDVLVLDVVAAEPGDPRERLGVEKDEGGDAVLERDVGAADELSQQGAQIKSPRPPAQSAQSLPPSRAKPGTSRSTPQPVQDPEAVLASF